MRIQHNIMAMNAYRNLGNNNKALSGNLEKLSSGYKINRAGDDAAGLAISEKMRAQITSLDAAQKNVNDGISLVKTAEGAMQEIQDMLNRMEYLATQSANGTYDNDVDRANLQKEVDALKSEINRIADASNFNGTKLLDGSLAETIPAKAATFEVDLSGATALESGKTYKLTVAGQDVGESAATGGTTAADLAAAFDGKTVTIDSKTFTAAVSGSKLTFTADDTGSVTLPATTVALAKGTTTAPTGDPNVTTAVTNFVDGADETAGAGLELQIGDTADSYNKLKVNVNDMHTAALGIDTVDISSQTGASNAIAAIKTAINTVSSTRGDLGAIQNRLEHTNKNLAVMEENITDAESTIRDTDIADEMMAYTKNNILIQSAQAMLAQANQVPQGVLQLMQ